MGGEHIIAKFRNVRKSIVELNSSISDYEFERKTDGLNKANFDAVRYKLDLVSDILFDLCTDFIINL